MLIYIVCYQSFKMTISMEYDMSMSKYFRWAFEMLEKHLYYIVIYNWNTLVMNHFICKVSRNYWLIECFHSSYSLLWFCRHVCWAVGREGQFETLHEVRGIFVFLLYRWLLCIVGPMYCYLCIIDIIFGFLTLYIMDDVTLIVYNIKVFLVFVCLYIFACCMLGQV